MTAEERYKEAKSRYAGIAVDTDRICCFFIGGWGKTG